MGLGILRGEHHPHDLAAVVIMLKNLLTNELAFAVAVGGEPNPLGGAQCLANGFELGGLVSATSSGSSRSNKWPSAGRITP
jgi:hypothetical protein